MAMPLGFLSVAGMSSFSKSPSLMFVKPQPQSFNVKPCSSRVVTFATAASSEPVTETAAKKRAPRGFSKPRPVSQEMKDFLGGRTEIPRTEVLKVIWAHIKEKDLQDPTNKRVIKCDEKLKKIFGEREQVGFLEIAGLISPHFKKAET